MSGYEIEKTTCDRCHNTYYTRHTRICNLQACNKRGIYYVCFYCCKRCKLHKWDKLFPGLYCEFGCKNKTNEELRAEEKKKQEEAEAAKKKRKRKKTAVPTEEEDDMGQLRSDELWL